MPCNRHHPYHDQDCSECNDEWDDRSMSCHSVLGWLFIILVIGVIIYLLMRNNNGSNSFGCGCSAVRTGAKLGCGQPKMVNPQKLNQLLDEMI